MSQMRGAFLAVFLCFLLGCGQDKQVVSASEKDSFLRFAQKEISWLQKTQPSIRKTVTRGELVNTETFDSVDWVNELEMLNAWSLSEAKKKFAYDETIDSSGILMIVRYNARDTAAELQELMVTYRKGLIDLMQWTIQQRSWYIDRDLRLSFQPRKGYGVIVKQDVLWASPEMYDIFVEINNSQFLNNSK